MSDGNLSGYEGDNGIIEPPGEGFMTFDEGDNERFLSNFPKDDPDAMWELTSLASSPDCKGGSDIINSVIDLKYWMVHEVEVMDDDDQLVRAIRTVLIDKSGDAFAFVSNGIFRSLRMFCKCYGQGPYEEARPLQVIQSDTKGGRRILHLRPPAKKGRGK